MTREEAIKVLEDGFWWENLDEWYEQSNPEFGELHNAVDMAISALREQPRWISVKERLPKEFVSVLVYMPEERPLPTVHEGFLAREGVWYANHFDRDPMEITHWMPLPEPPKEEV